MAIVFNGTSSRILSSSFGASRPSAYSISAWIKADATYGTTLREPLRVGNTLAFPNDLGDLILYWGHPTAGNQARPTLHRTTSTYAATDTAGTNSAVWVNYCATYAATRLIFYENGVKIGATGNFSVTAGAPADWLVTVGGIAGSTFAGKIALVAYYDIELSADDAKALGAGFRPELVRPQSLVYSVAGLRDANATRGVTSTETDLAFSDDNPRIIW